MRLLPKGWPKSFGLLIVLAFLLSACLAGKGSFVEGEKALEQKNYDQAVVSYLNALEEEPDNQQYKLRLGLARGYAGLEHKAWGDKFFANGNYREALEEYQLAVDLDGSYYVAADAAENARNHLLAQKLVEEAEGLLTARRRSQAENAVEDALQAVPDFEPALRLQEKIKNHQYVLIDGVELEVNSKQLINLNFRDAKLLDVFDIITKLSGINFILDEDVRGSNTTLFLERATFSQALELLLRMNKLDKKILNSKTIILFPKTRDKQKQFEDQIIQTFFLSNIDAKKAVNLLRTMLQVRKIYVHEELNAIILRDTPSVIKLARKIIENNDRSNSEVVFDLELIEVSHNIDQELGLKLTNYSIGAGMGQTTTTDSDGNTSTEGRIVSLGVIPGQSTSGLIDGLDGFKDLDPFYSIPAANFRFMKTLIDAEILASPKIRVKNKEKAKVLVGSREPTITVTNNGDTSTDNVQYVDVGVKLNVEPNIQLDGSVVTKLGLEVSNVSARETTDNGTSVLTISTTNADTVLTLKDGEQTIIGGLIRDDRATTKYKMPLLGDIPYLGELFNGTDKKGTKTEILLSITPHIVKSVSLPAVSEASIWSGGEDDLKDGRNFGSFADEFAAGQQLTAPPVANRSEGQPGVVPAEELPVEQNLGEEPLQSPLSEAGIAAPSEPLTVNQQPPVIETAPEVMVAEVAVPQLQPPAAVVKPKVYAQSPKTVKPGETFSVTFFVNEVENLFSAPLYVQYDTQLFEFVGAVEGTFLKQGPSPTIFTHTALDGSGRIIVGLKQGAGGKGLSGGGELFSMEFKALGPGSGEIAPTRTNFRNPRGERLRVDSTGVTVEVGE